MWRERTAAPDGRQWRVRRRWVPRVGRESLLGRLRRRFATGTDGLGGLGDLGGCLDVDIGVIVVVVVVILAVLLFLFVGLPLLLALVDLVVVVIGTVLAVVGRVVFRRPWVVEASAGDDRRHEWRVRGWRRSGRHREEVRRLLAAGADLPPEATP